MTLSSLITALALVSSGPGGEPDPRCSGTGQGVAEICAVLEAQEAAWNRGDIPAFMEGYWQSEDLRFASGGSVTTGWQATLERYLARYDSPAAMGELDFSRIDVDQLSHDAAIAFGRWQLHRDQDAPSGLFTLVFRRIGEDWRIVHDHTSSAD